MVADAQEQRHLAEFQQVAIADASEARATAVEDSSLAGHGVNEPDAIGRVDESTLEVGDGSIEKAQIAAGMPAH